MKKIKLTDNALTVLTKRDYLKRDKDGRVTETPEQMFRRVSQAIAAAEKPYGGVKAVKDWAAKFYDAMSNLEFLPNSPTLMHAGTKFNQLSACFVLPLEDNLASIFKTMEEAATIARTGGGVGIPLSNLRARGTKVKSTGGVTSGPISFLQLFNQMANVINEGSSRRVAMMAVMNVHHPDIMDFIFAKGVEEEIKNFNISVGATDVFMKAVLANKDYELRSPGHTPGELGEVVKKISARRVMDMITFQAWKTADPGMVFLDRMNQQSPVNHLGLIETTNPCGEQPLLAYESCNLGSINLAKCLNVKGINWEKTEALVRLGVRFLDDVIDICSYPLPEIDAMSKKTRKIGLGVMGLADLLVLLKIPYASNEALKLSERLAKFIQNIARDESKSLAQVRGSFPAFKGSLWDRQGFKAMRNSTVNTVAPTGTISIIANCSSGIEPLFALTYVRKNILDVNNTELIEVNQKFEKTAKENQFYSKELMRQVSVSGGIDGLPGVPKDIKEIFKVSHEIGWDGHVKMQAAWQKHIDAAVSKTINLVSSATPDDIREAYLLAYETGCKGITVYRDGSKTKQVLNVGLGIIRQPIIDDQRKWVGNGHREEELCPECGGELTFKEGCANCLACGYSRCLIS
ncbi:ribonucleoside-diphosphate reductase, adenosylcobalamin-dependent [Candidatus Beckwithbacteria bacterium RIFCSPHIGHO2_12_FULL_47_17]|uniref:Vitamin B12-dependent ribonucleotide reductase n=1 Tax=Candidatus Beckwithbacteria bacterium RIFCSPHIGHO2_12_FULL_47_17 TaxID=1797460 RepID=A0A1F5DM80_9BACT|nr:MAG: ribonucleoside-diphosphate reductase, adenosylcobalamin-dependent [Candidatus Beckwithbacteria bacterium RIFCSPHIGHO2_12_FULL_47_17]